MPADFKKLVSARFLFTFAVQMQAVVVGWQVYSLTHDALALGLIGLAEAIPALSLALYAGYAVDSSRPVVAFRFVLGASLLSALVLLVAQPALTEISASSRVRALYLSCLITGAARSFSQPAIFALVPRIVPRDKLAQASAWSNSAVQIARIGGPALGGVIYGWLGSVVSACTVCGTLVAGLLLMSTFASMPQSSISPAREQHLREELLSGATFVMRHPVLFPALTLDMISVLFGGVTAILPIYAAEILMVGPKGLGFLRAAPGVAAALTSFWLAYADIRKRAGSWLFASVAGFGLTILVFALSRNYYLSLCALGLGGGFDSVSMMIRSAAVQLVSPDAMRGRISAVNSIFIGSSNELGGFESGVAAKLMGTVPSVLLGAAVCLATVVAIAVIFPQLKRLDLEKL